MSDFSSIPFEHLREYLSDTGWLSSLQLALFVTVIYQVLYRSLRALQLLGDPLPKGEVIATEQLDGLTRLCLGLGLLLTFSGMYGYIGSGEEGGNSSLLLALGSSAVGYSAWTICAVGPVVDSLRTARDHEPTGGERETEPNDAAARGLAVKQTRAREQSGAVSAAPVSKTEHNGPPKTARRRPGRAKPQKSAKINTLTDQEILGYLDHEQKPSADSGCGGGHLGSDVHHPSPPGPVDLGSLGGYQLGDRAAPDQSGPASPDLDDEQWAYRYLAGDEPGADA